MLTTGNDLLAYKGDETLGASGGEGKAIDTKEINNAFQNAAYVNMQKNRIVWQQKIQERDEAMDLLQSGKLNIGKVPPEYQKELEDTIAQVKEIYFNNGGDLKSDPRIWQEVNNKLADFNDKRTYAQSKLLEYNKEADMAAKETNPIKKQKIQENMKANMQKPLNEPYMPYQQTLDWDPAKVDLPAPVKLLSTERNGDYDVTTSVTDLEKYREQFYQQWVNNKDGDTPWHMEAFMDGFLGNDGIRPKEAVKENIDMVNKKLQDINIQMGLKEGDRGYLKPLQVMVDPQGKVRMGDNTADAVYKIMLAKNFARTTDQKLNLDYAKQRKIQSEIDLNKARSAAQRSAIPVNQARARYWNNKGSEIENINHVQNIFDDVLARTKGIQLDLVQNGKPVKQQFRGIFTKDLPEGFIKVLGGVDENGKPISIQPFRAKGGDGDFFKVVESPFFVNGSNGNRFSEADIKEAFKSQRQFKKYDDFLKHMRSKGIAPEIEIEGVDAEGRRVRATSQSTIQALRALNNKLRSGKNDDVLYGNDDGGGYIPDDVEGSSYESSGGSASE